MPDRKVLKTADAIRKAFASHGAVLHVEAEGDYSGNAYAYKGSTTTWFMADGWIIVNHYDAGEPDYSELTPGTPGYTEWWEESNHA